MNDMNMSMPMSSGDHNLMIIMLVMMVIMFIFHTGLFLWAIYRKRCSCH